MGDPENVKWLWDPETQRRIKDLQRPRVEKTRLQDARALVLEGTCHKVILRMTELQVEEVR